MKQWEVDRVNIVGDKPAFWVLMPDFETHFDAFRTIAGEPIAGTRGRVLPEYDHKWAESFWNLINSRKNRWDREAIQASPK